MILESVPTGPAAAEAQPPTSEVDKDTHIEQLSIDETNLPVVNGCWSPTLC